MSSILSKNQRRILTLLSAEQAITGLFYLTGGTALAEYYLHHRVSEDLDFFSENEVVPEAVMAVLKKIQKPADITSFSFEQSFNRNLFLLELQGESIKTEFTYFPFSRIESKEKIGGLAIDSLLDIAVNKLFTIHQKPRARDFIDLFCILQKEKDWNIAELMKKARIKFDSHIDPLQLASQFVKAETLKDYPRMLTPLPETTWISFFLTEAKDLSQSQLK
jgi:predicted nucleotidyltransferase component of viral defense system